MNERQSMVNISRLLVGGVSLRLRNMVAGMLTAATPAAKIQAAWRSTKPWRLASLRWQVRKRASKGCASAAAAATRRAASKLFVPAIPQLYQRGAARVPGPAHSGKKEAHPGDG